MVSFVKTNKEIAKVLGIKLLRQRNRLRGQLAEINGWRARPDFPANQKGKGFSAVEVLQWGEKYAAMIAPEKQRRAVVADILSGETPSRQALKTLGNIQHSTFNIQHSSGEGDGSQKSEVRSQMGNPGPVPSQAAMAVELQLRYQLPIKRQTIHNWIHGIHLPNGGGSATGLCPKFPMPDPGRAGWNNPQPCYDWYEKWIVAPLRAAGEANPIQGNLFEQKKADAIIAEFEEQIDKARKARSEADALERANSAKWILRTEATSTAARAIHDILNIVETEYERNAAGKRRDFLQGLMSKVQGLKPGDAEGAERWTKDSGLWTELLAQFSAWDAEEERGRIDRIRASCAGKTQINAKQAAQLGNQLKAHLKWPEEMCKDSPLPRKCENCVFWKVDRGVHCFNGWSGDGSKGFCRLEPTHTKTDKDNLCQHFEPNA